MKSEKLKFSTYPVVIGFLCSLGTLLRIRQFLSDRSLWLDEAMLALNIVTRSFSELLEPLLHSQAAPLGFLFFEKIIVKLFGNHEFSLRIFPLLMGVIAIFLMLRVTKAYVGDSGCFLGLGLFVLSEKLIYYSSEVKQYSSDVTLTLALLLLAPKCFEPNASPKRLMTFALAASVCVWFSHPIVFVIGGIFAALIVDVLCERKARTQQKLFWIGLAALICAGSFYLTFAISLK